MLLPHNQIISSCIWKDVFADERVFFIFQKEEKSRFISRTSTGEFSAMFLNNFQITYLEDDQYCAVITVLDYETPLSEVLGSVRLSDESCGEKILADSECI